ncbi:MAG: hypothetical protein NT040_19770, partial [Bacteroidetes bacterium]|nr:hypothetical protein [Bacteroidota bacterium]
MTVSKPVKAQTYGTPLFTEDFGTVPTGQDANSYRGEITGRGTIGNTFWFWPYSCPVAGQRWLTDFTPTLEISYALVLPAREQGITEWTIVQVTELTTGLPYNTGYVNNPNNTWCLYEEKSGVTWTWKWSGPNTTCPAASSTIRNVRCVRWYDVYGTWKLGHWERYHLRYDAGLCSDWHNGMDDGGYALSTNPDYVHGQDAAWHVGPDHTSGDVNGMMLVVNAAMIKGLFYKREITGLCYGAQFEYKSYFANVLKKTSCGGNSQGIDINIRYEIWSKDPGDDEANSTVIVGGSSVNGNGAVLLAQTNTGDITESTTLTWIPTSLIFNVPQNQDKVFIILRNNGPGGCGNDLAIDDITFRPYIPFTIGYTRIATDYCTTGLIRLKATLTSGSIPVSIPYVFQWQEAPQGTSNWVNIGSPITDFNNAFIDLNLGDIGNKIYRIISAASVQNFNNSNCYVASASFDGNSVVLPTGSLNAPLDVCGTINHSSVQATFTVNYQGNIFPWTYYYKINNGAELSQVVNSPNITNSKTINITDNTTVTLVRISTADCDVAVNSTKLIIYSIGYPAGTVPITGPNPACIGTEADFSVPEIQGATSYTWQVPVPGTWSVISGQGTRFVRLKIGTESIYVTITTSNACGVNVQTTSALFQTTNSPPEAPTVISTPNGLCFPPSATPGNTDILFEASLVSGAQNYEWSWDSPVVYNLGSQQAGTGQYLRRIILSIPNSASTFTVRVKTQNGCGYSLVVREGTFAPNRLPAITLGSNPSVCRGTTSANLTYATTTGSPDKYSIDYDATANTAGFTDVTNATLPASPIVLAVPATAAAGTYNGTLTVKNSTTGCISGAYAITVTVNPVPTISLGSNPSVCRGTTSANLTYTATTGSPDKYSIDYDATANTAGFTDVTYITLPASPIVLAIPGAAAAGTYNGTLTVKNSTTGCISSAYAITVMVNPVPTISLVTNPSVCRGTTSANLAYSATTGSPDKYSIDYDATANTAGFTDVANATLSTSPIVLTVPAAAAAGTYNGILSVKNSTTGCISST